MFDFKKLIVYEKAKSLNKTIARGSFPDDLLYVRYKLYVRDKIDVRDRWSKRERIVVSLND
jgi:hypothetical protein